MKDTSALEKAEEEEEIVGGTTTGRALTQKHFKTNGLNVATQCSNARQEKCSLNYVMRLRRGIRKDKEGLSKNR